MSGQRYDALARRFARKLRIVEEPWPSGFLTDAQKTEIRQILRGKSRPAIEKFIRHIDGECIFYRDSTPRWSEDDHHKRLQRIANVLYDAQDAIDELRTIRLRRRFRFTDLAESRGLAIDKANNELEIPAWTAKLSLGDVADVICRELSPCWQPQGRHVTYVPPLKSVNRKGGRPSVKDSRFVELLVEIARVFPEAFGKPASTSKTGAFALTAGVLASALGVADKDPSRSVAAAIRQTRAS